MGGKSKARLIVDEAGFVTDATLLEETPQGFGFGDAALAAARRWTFQPGKPGMFTITMKFSPSDGSEAIDYASLPKCPKPIERVTPRYPADAEKRASNALVSAILKIADDGSVAQTYIALEMPVGLGFGKSAKAALDRWRFSPGQAGLYTVTVNFAMAGEDTAVHWNDLPLLPQPIHRVAPKYPEAARAEGRTGRLKVGVFVAEDGSVLDVKLVTESPKHQGFGEAARAALMLWRFKDVRQGMYRLKLDIPAPKH